MNACTTTSKQANTVVINAPTAMGLKDIILIYVKLISKPRLPLSNDCTQVTKESNLLCLYFIKQQEYSNSRFNL